MLLTKSKIKNESLLLSTKGEPTSNPLTIRRIIKFIGYEEITGKDGKKRHFVSMRAIRKWNKEQLRSKNFREFCKKFKI